MAANELTTLARLGAVFERTVSVRDQADLEVVLKDLCAAIAETLGYGAAVVNVYRPAFDDMFTAAAVGSDASIKALVGRASPAETWHPLLAERFERRGAYFVPGDEFDWESLGADTFVPDIEPSDDPNAWTAEDALFVPLHDAKGAADRRDLGGRARDRKAPDRRRARRARRDRPPGGDRAAHRPGDGDDGPAPAHARGRPRRVGSARRGGRDRRGAAGRLRRHPRRARVRPSRDRARRRAEQPPRPGGLERMGR